MSAISSTYFPPPLEEGSVGAVETTVRFVDLAEQTRLLEPALTAAWHAVLARGDFVLGEAVDRLEREFAAYCGVAHAVGVDSGFSALELALRAAGCGPGDEVITQANTFVATASAILACGARPVLVDCDDQGAMDPAAIAPAISPRTRAIIPVHLFGRIADMDPLLQLADRHGLVVIEDACQAHGAVFQNRSAGSFGEAAAFSFYPAKNLGAFGDGGMLVTRSAEIAAEVRSVRHYGQRSKYLHERRPLNRRLDTLQAAVLRVKLPYLDGWNRRRQLLADAYRDRLDGLPITLPRFEVPGRHVYHLFVIQVEERDALQHALKAAGIETGIHYPIPLHRLPALKELGYGPRAFPRAEWLAARSLSLPMYPELPIAHVDRVATAISRFFAR
jgi:dTDP-4-amino-4,6-dideoxygalactose transaminase